jgi:hypothetical protein
MKLTRFEDRWAQASLAVMFPGSTAEGFADIGRMDVHGYLDEVMRTFPFRVALGFRVAVWLVALSPLVICRKVATIAGLAPGEREQVVDRLLSSRTYSVRSLVMLLKTFGALLYAGDAQIRARLRPATRRASVPLRIKRAHVA